MSKLHFLVFALATLLGVESTFLYLEKGTSASLAAKLDASKASERTAWGKLYDKQERQDDEAFSEQAALHMRVFNAEQALQTCRDEKEKMKPRK